MPEKQYLIFLDADARKRHYHLTKAGKVTKFVVQLEVKIGKINLYLDYRDALTLADDDINENWETYREKFLKGELP